MLQQIAIYGAKSIALGTCQAVRSAYPEKKVIGFLVSSMDNNPSTLAGLPVMEIGKFSEEHPAKEEITVLIGTPETVHPEIIKSLEQYGFSNYFCIDSLREEELMEGYFSRNKIFPSLHALSADRGERNADNLCVFAAGSHKDAGLKHPGTGKKWLSSLQAGADLTDLRAGEYFDNTGENISHKNVNYCELTALYWIWKNILPDAYKEDELRIGKAEYYGLFQYRRFLNVTDADLCRIQEGLMDVILPFPTLHEPDIREHHERYIKEEDWNAMLRALEEVHPEYAKAFPAILNQPYLYNYNLIIAKKDILRKYCEWLFPVLERTEQLSSPKGWERADRYIGYLGENLLTLYFLYHKDDFNIVHTGRIMLT